MKKLFVIALSLVAVFASTALVNAGCKNGSCSIKRTSRVVKPVPKCTCKSVKPIAVDKHGKCVLCGKKR